MYVGVKRSICGNGKNMNVNKNALQSATQGYVRCMYNECDIIFIMSGMFAKYGEDMANGKPKPF